MSKLSFDWLKNFQYKETDPYYDRFMYIRKKRVLFTCQYIDKLSPISAINGLR